MALSTKSPNEADVAVGKAVRYFRERRGMAQQALASAIGVTFQQIQKYEKGVNRLSVGRLMQIAATLEVPVTELLGEEIAASGALNLSAEALWVAASYDQLDTKDQEAITCVIRAFLRGN